MPEERPRIKNHKLYFGRTMRFADNNGNVYEEAFYIPSSSVDTPNKTVTLTETIYRSIDSFEWGEPPIAEGDGGIRKKVYRGERFDAFVAANAQVIAAGAQVVHNTFDSIKDTPKVDGTFESFFASASAVILP